MPSLDYYAALVDKALADSDEAMTPGDREMYGDSWTRAALAVVGGLAEYERLHGSD
jgi:hypothetical protein